MTDVPREGPLALPRKDEWYPNECPFCTREAALACEDAACRAAHLGEDGEFPGNGRDSGWLAQPAEPTPCRVLDAHWPGVPNVGDITTADWAPWAGRIDWLTAGWPCQPWSTSGKKKGTEDERAIWPAVARAIRDLRPRIVLLENVASIAPLGELGRALADLANLGFDAEWRCVRASDAGAPHRRRRIFILAVAADRAGQGWGSLIEEHVDRVGGEAVRAGQAEPGRRDRAAADPESLGHERPRNARHGRPGHADSGAPAADARGAGLEVVGVESAREELASAERGGGAAADSDRGGRGRDEGGTGRCRVGRAAADGDRPAGLEWGAYGPAVRRWELVLGRPAPAPVVVGRRGGRQLSPQFVEWLMGLPAGWVTDVPGLARTDQIHLLGNGVVPAQALLAYRAMLPELIERTAA